MPGRSPAADPGVRVLTSAEPQLLAHERRVCRANSGKLPEKLARRQICVQKAD